MDISLTETQRLLRDSIRDYLRNEVPFDRVRALEQDGGYDRDLWRSLQAAGYLGLPFSEARGGGGGTLTDLAVVLEEIAQELQLAPREPVPLPVARHGVGREVDHRVADADLAALDVQGRAWRPRCA